MHQRRQLRSSSDIPILDNVLRGNAPQSLEVIALYSVDLSFREFCLLDKNTTPQTSVLFKLCFPKNYSKKSKIYFSLYQDKKRNVSFKIKLLR